MADKWYDKSVKQTEIWLKTDTARGLTKEEAAKRRKIDGENDIYSSPKKSFFSYLKHLLTDYTSILMLIVLLIAEVFEESESLTVMILILITYYAVVLFTYVKSQKILEGLGAYALPNAKVLRDGKLFMVKQKQLVRGDIIYISAGDIVPCDARIFECDGLEVLEVNLTSVTHAVMKDAKFIDYHDISPANQKNMIFASTIVTRGTAKAICCETGSDTLVCSMKKNAPVMSDECIEIMDKIGVISKKWTLVMTLSVMFLTIANILLSRYNLGLFDSFMNGLSLAVSSMSEFYVAFAYIVLSCGIFTAVNKKKDINTGALIKNTDKIENIKNLSCLIVPREAAFSIRDMKIKKVYANGDVFTVGEHGYRRNASRVLRYALLSTGLYGAGKLIANNQRRENIYSSEEEAIITAAEKCGEYNIELEKRYPMLQHVAKGQYSRFDTTLVQYENGFFTAIRGEYNLVLPVCRYYTEDSRVYEMTPEKRNEFLIEAEKLARESYRIIAIASKDTIYNNLKRISAVQSDLTFEGFLAIEESVLPEAAKNVSRCTNAGIKIIMLCPDVSCNNEVFAESLGIINSSEQVISSNMLSKMKEGLFRANLDIYRVYQGLNLAQKRLLVRFLQEKGERVGYLCSDLDEIILMKEADVGYSESLTISEKAGNAGIDIAGRNLPIFNKNFAGAGGIGCEALKFVSDVIVSEADKSGTGGFNAVVDSIICSKSVYYNLNRMIKYLILSQLSKLFIVTISVFMGISVFTPPQILFCGLIIDFFALIIIAFERSGPEILKMPSYIADKLKRPFWSNSECVILGIFWAVCTLALIQFMIFKNIISESQISVCCFLSFIFTQISMLNECKREQSIFSRNVRINGAYITMLIIIILFMIISFKVDRVGIWFNIKPISLNATLGVVSIPIIMTFCCEMYKLFTKKSSGRPSKN